MGNLRQLTLCDETSFLAARNVSYEEDELVFVRFSDVKEVAQSTTIPVGGRVLRITRNFNGQGAWVQTSLGAVRFLDQGEIYPEKKK